MLLSPPHPKASLRSPWVLLPILSHVQLLRTHSTEGKPSEPPDSSAQRRVRGPLAGKDSLLLFLSMDFHRSGRYFSSLRCRETKSRIPRRGVCQSHLSNTDGRFFFFFVLRKSWSLWKVVPTIKPSTGRDDRRWMC